MLLHGRSPKYPVFPGNIFWREVDVSDPHTFLFLKRGVIQYVQVKPILAVATIILKLVGKFNEGNLRANSGYLYVSVVYNCSICLALYCLAIFWMCVSEDLKPFRPMPKFLCVKGILFFSFWQSLLISILVAAGAITKLGPYTDNEHISLGLTDTLICLEMPLFAIAHMYAFSTRDFVDPRSSFVARMPVFYAARDAFGLKDVVEDCKVTLRGEGMDYREFEPSEGFIHQGAGRDRRIRAGLRYSQGGKKKYWLPQRAQGTRPAGSVERTVNRAVQRVAGEDETEDVYAPLLADQAQDVVHTAPDLRSPTGQAELGLFDSEPLQDEGFGLQFGDIDDADEALYSHSKKYVFGDYLYPCVDVSSEAARKTMWDEEERILRDERGAYFSPMLGPGRILGQARQSYGAMGNFQRGVVRERVTSDTSDGSRGKGKTRAGREVVIDKEQDRVPEANMGEVRLRWTNSQDRVASQSPRVRTSSATARPAAMKPTSSGSSGSSPAVKHPPPSPRKETERPVLPPDAVDLIVEDPHAAEEEQTHERRKGEPAVRGKALHKVYRRGYVVGDRRGREEGEVEVANAATPSPDEQQTIFEVGEDADSVMNAEERAVEEVTVAKAETPPPHARPMLYSPELLDDENPWA
ncbi:organic solute transporter Ostalpha-domain-containing protein [Fomitopsis serialis]|uniref:organic solute transporter Ostalpha-domain-containing protein n=1 Tax=Fomitopsis serialis TaxID=139415 RepID=UPI00200849D3|nr:organic solute transporter Ostalpha-domain-containing protein [Neoantrodia serialis]KAH9918064.1 organic solute transporter Ostalpha-domain-containing protein [Neoantrodia serialis]